MDFLASGFCLPQIWLFKDIWQVKMDGRSLSPLCHFVFQISKVNFFFFESVEQNFSANKTADGLLSRNIWGRQNTNKSNVERQTVFYK